MSDAEDKLNELSDFFRRMSAKVKLIKLIEHAKIEYDKYNLDDSSIRKVCKGIYKSHKGWKFYYVE